MQVKTLIFNYLFCCCLSSDMNKLKIIIIAHFLGICSDIGGFGSLDYLPDLHLPPLIHPYGRNRTNYEDNTKDEFY